jgi:hypothetical protein
MGNQELSTLEDEARRLKVPISWLYSRTRIKNSDFPCLRVGKYIRVNHEAILAWLEKQNAARG